MSAHNCINMSDSWGLNSMSMFYEFRFYSYVFPNCSILTEESSKFGI